MVAVAAALSDPPQQSEMLGQRASSHTVCRFSPRRSCLMDLRFGLLPGEGRGVCSQEGRRVISFCLPLPGLPTRAVRGCWEGEGEGEGSVGGEVKSKREGPALRRSVNVVSRRGWGVAGEVGSVGSETAVARVRAGGIEERVREIGGGLRERMLGILGGMLTIYKEIDRDDNFHRN